MPTRAEPLCTRSLAALSCRGLTIFQWPPLVGVDSFSRMNDWKLPLTALVAASLLISLADLAGDMSQRLQGTHEWSRGLGLSMHVSGGHHHGDTDDHHDGPSSDCHHHEAHCCCTHSHMSVAGDTISNDHAPLHAFVRPLDTYLFSRILSKTLFHPPLAA